MSPFYGALFCLLLTCEIVTSSTFNFTDIAVGGEIPVESDRTAVMDLFRKDTTSRLEEALSKIASLEMTTNGLLMEVSTLRSNNIAMSVAMHALNAARKHEIQSLRNDFEAAMNETRNELKSYSAQIALLQSRNQTHDAYTARPPITSPSWYYFNQTTSRSPKNASIVQDRDCVFQRGGYCYFTYDWYMTYAQAEAACSQRQATIGYPVDEYSYRKIVGIIRQKLPPNWTSWAGIWTGFSYGNQGLKLPNGDVPPYRNWRRGEPSRGYNENRVMIMIYKTAAGHSEGMDDVRPSRDMHGAICMRKIY